jgi:hypothetical protein
LPDINPEIFIKEFQQYAAWKPGPLEGAGPCLFYDIISGIGHHSGRSVRDFDDSDILTEYVVHNQHAGLRINLYRGSVSEYEDPKSANSSRIYGTT